MNRNENCWASTVIPTTLIRDFLHEYSDISHDKVRFQIHLRIGHPIYSDFEDSKKTSTACFRRLARRLKDHQPKHDVYIEKLWNDDLFIGKFRPEIHK